MKAITIWQPWASLIMIGAKPFEFRPRSYLDYANHPHVGDCVVIHAGVRPVRPAEVEDLLKRLESPHSTTGLIAAVARPVLERVRASHKYRLLPLGAGLGTAIIGKPRNAGMFFRRPVSADVAGLYDAEEIAELNGELPSDSDRGEFNWAWPLSDIVHFEPPVLQRGFQGFWNWPQRIAA